MRRIVESLLVVGALALPLAPAHGDDYPSRRITLIAPSPERSTRYAASLLLALAIGLVSRSWSRTGPAPVRRLVRPMPLKQRPTATRS